MIDILSISFVKLPAHRAESFAERKFYSSCAPFLPAGSQGPLLHSGACGALAGQGVITF